MNNQDAGSVGEDTKVSIRIVWFLGMALVSLTSWTVKLSFDSSIANAKGDMAIAQINELNEDLSKRRDKNKEFQLDVVSRLSRMEAKMDDLMNHSKNQ